MAFISKRTTALTLCSLLLPACTGFSSIHIEFDYSMDKNGFFSGKNIGRRKLLEQAAQPFEDRILDNFTAITPTGSDTWTITMRNPSNGDPALIFDSILPENTIRIYVGARDMGGVRLGFATVGFDAIGSAAFRNLVESRNSATNYDSIGGSIAFEINANFYFDEDPSTLEPFPDQYDFYSVAQHEIGHLLGFAAGSRAFKANSVNGAFVGPNAVAVYGGPVPLSPDGGHFGYGVMLNGQNPAMRPAATADERTAFSELDFAVLKDIGYSIKPPVESLPISAITQMQDGSIRLDWQGGTGPYRVQTKSSLTSDWVSINQNPQGRSMVLWPEPDIAFFRILDLQGQ